MLLSREQKVLERKINEFELAAWWNIFPKKIIQAQLFFNVEEIANNLKKKKSEGHSSQSLEGNVLETENQNGFSIIMRSQ